MLSSSTGRGESQHTMTQLHNLITKYECLEQKYNLLKLENEQYRQLIDELEIQNRDLRDQVECFENTLATENHLKPMLKLHISSIKNELNVFNRENKTLTHQIREQSEIIISLKKQNGQLLRQNNEYRTVLETNNKHTQLLENKKQQQIEEKENKISLLQNEIDILREELTTIKCKQSNPEQTFSINLPDMQAIRFLGNLDNSIHLNSERRYTLTHSHSAQHCISDPFSDKENDFNLTFNEFNDVNELQIVDQTEMEIDIEINELKTENIELKQELNQLKTEEKCVCGGYKFLSDSDSDDEFDEEEDEISEMEKLYEKCEGEIINTNNITNQQIINDNNLILKYKWLFFELQLRRNNVKLNFCKQQ